MPAAAEPSAEQRHRIALARELTYAAGVPLRDQYGYAAADTHVLAVLDICFGQPDDRVAAAALGAANLIGELELATTGGDPLDEQAEARIVAALRPLVEGRRDAAARALRSS